MSMILENVSILREWASSTYSFHCSYHIFNLTYFSPNLFIFYTLKNVYISHLITGYTQLFHPLMFSVLYTNFQ